MTGDVVALRFRPVGTSALLVEVDDVDQARSVYRWITEAQRLGTDAPRAPRDVVPAARSVLLDGVDPSEWQRLLSAQEISLAPLPAGDDVVVPVSYDGEDLEDVAAAWGCTVDEVVARHTGADYVVAFCGFAPGFAYCEGVPPLPTVRRRDVPRERVPAGSVALGGEFCGVYPREMPGGWQLIGRTDVALFDPARGKPALLQPGDRVRFEATT